MIITGLDRQKAGETAELLDRVCFRGQGVYSAAEKMLLDDLIDALRDAERRASLLVYSSGFDAYCDGVD